MKKLIKFLFPKTYQSIYNEGYSYHEYLTYGQYEGYQDEYDPYMDEYPEGYWEAHYPDDTLQDEDCYEEEIPQVQEPVVTKPDLKVGDKIHLHSKQGMYTVVAVFDFCFAYNTKHCDAIYTMNSDYKCHAGGLWNSKGE